MNWQTRLKLRKLGLRLTFPVWGPPAAILSFALRGSRYDNGVGFWGLDVQGKWKRFARPFTDLRRTVKYALEGHPREACFDGCWYYCKGHTGAGA